MLSNLHDSVALGNFEEGLIHQQPDVLMDDDDNGGGDKSNEKQQEAEVERLPLLLRVLSKSRPLAAVKLPDLKKSSKEKKKEEDDTDTDEELKNEAGDKSGSAASVADDEVLEQAVRRLEDRAAFYSISESIEVVSVHLAPHVCRKIAKLPPCRRKASSSGGHGHKLWDINDLTTVAQNPASSRFQQGNSKRRKVSINLQDQSKRTSDGPDEFSDSDNEYMEQELDGIEEEKSHVGSTKGLMNTPKRKRLTSSGERDSILLAAGAAEDSQEAFVTKTLSELALLVAHYLKHQNSLMRPSSSTNKTAADGYEEGGKDNDPADGATAESNMFSMEESILAQSRVVSRTLLGTDLGATVASLLYYATVLKHSHVAAALCEAGQPQAPHLIQRLAANCPAAIPGLVRGCLSTFADVTPKTHRNLGDANEGNLSGKSTLVSSLVDTKHQLAHDSLLALSQLSRRERQRIRTALRGVDAEESPLLLLLQLQCTLEHDDPVDLSCFLLKKLPRNPFVAAELVDMKMEDVRSEEGASEGVNDSLAQRAPSLAVEIHSNAKMWVPKICHCLASGWKHSSVKGLAPHGKLCLLLRSYLWVVLTASCNNVMTAIDMQMPQLLELVELVLPDFRQNAETGSKDDIDERNFFSNDDLYCLLLAVLLFSKSFLMKAEDDGVSGIAKALNELWKTAFSRNSRAFLGCISCVLQSDEKEPLLRCLLLEHLCTKDEDMIGACRSCHRGDEIQLREWCRTNLDLRAALETSLLETNNPTAALETLQWKPEFLSSEKLRGIVQSLVLNQSEQSRRLLADNNTYQLILESISRPSTCGGPHLPIVQSLHLEIQASSFSKSTTRSMDAASANYLLMLIYCFAFREAQPNSPFAFDPLSIPLKRVLLLLHDETLQDDISPKAKMFLIRQINESSPYAVELAQYHKRLLSLNHLRLTNKLGLQSKEELIKAMRTNIKLGKDRSGTVMEQLVLCSFLNLSEQDFVSTVASSYLSEQNKSPPLHLSYSKLCQDPLVVLKIPMENFWNRAGFRRSALFLLRLLLNANTTMLDAVYTDETTQRELIAARDVLAVGCLISTSFEQSGCARNCFSTVGLIRGVIASHSGLAALLFKQAIPTEEIDWVTDAVPELFADAEFFKTDLFADDTISLSPAERLSIADGVMRTLVLYGQRDERSSEALALASLSQLVAGFFLVLGPSGVAVSSLLSGSSNTSLSMPGLKTSALRILKHVAGVRGYRKQLRSECVVGLLKLLRMCKGEELVGGLSVAVGGGGRQKAVLREIQDAIAKAMSSMGAVSN